jgi:hypothetical protein
VVEVFLIKIFGIKKARLKSLANSCRGPLTVGRWQRFAARPRSNPPKT